MPIPIYILLSDTEDEMHDAPTHDTLSDSEEEMPLPQEDPAEDPEETPVMGQDMDPEDGYDPDDDEEMEEEPALADTVPPPTPSDATPPPAQPIDPQAQPEEPTPADPQTFPEEPTYADPVPSPPLTSSTTTSDRWDRIPETLLRWRLQEGDPFHGVLYPSEPALPITLEPHYHTIPLLIARLERQQTHIRRLEQVVETLAGPTRVDQLQEDVWRLEHSFQNLRDATLEAPRRVSADENRLRMIEHRLGLVEHGLDRHHALTDSVRGYAHHILHGDHGRQQ